MNMKLEVVIVPVSDVDRAKAFYEKLGFRLDIDIVNENFRGIQFTPPNSEASIIFGKGVTSARLGSAEPAPTDVTPLPKMIDASEPGGVNCIPRKFLFAMSISNRNPIFS